MERILQQIDDRFGAFDPHWEEDLQAMKVGFPLRKPGIHSVNLPLREASPSSARLNNPADSAK